MIKLFEIKFLKYFKKHFYIPQWQIGIAIGDIDSILKTRKLPQISWWDNLPSALFNADPFILGRRVLYERMNRWRGRAEIWSSNFDGTDSKPFLKKPWHLSYPSVYKDNNSTYLVIESSASGFCSIMQLKSNKWVEISRINHPIVDPTLVYHEGRIWLFGTLANNFVNSELHLWWADSIYGPWFPHNKNPIKRDSSSSRPAGNIVKSSYGLIRPAQDCSKSYGSATVLCRIDQLDTDNYSETVLLKLNPEEPYSNGIHTLNIDNNFIVVDGKRLVFHPLSLILNKLSSYGMKYNPKNITQ